MTDTPIPPGNRYDVSAGDDGEVIGTDVSPKLANLIRGCLGQDNAVVRVHTGEPVTISLPDPPPAPQITPVLRST